ncbi:MAG: hypothetical protein ACFFD6_06675 [Candidatus Thorarchaeota archaeon]
MEETKSLASADRWKRRLNLLVPVLLVLLIFAPYEIELRLSTESYSMTAEILAWTWAYRMIGNPIGFYSLPYYYYLQQPLLYTFLHFVFMAALVGYGLGLISKKDTMNIGLFSLVPGIFVMAINIILGVLTPGSSSVIAPIPLPFAPILGLLALRTIGTESGEDSWLLDSKEAPSNPGTEAHNT